MNPLRIYVLLISVFLGIYAHSQTKSNDSISVKNPKHQLFIGVDLLNPVAGFFADKKNYSSFIAYKIKNRWLAVAEVGYEKNIYNKNNWNIDAKGVFGEIGINYILTNNYEKSGEGFYIGGRFGYSPFKQNVKKYPLKGMNPEGQIRIIGEGSLPEANVSSGWLEAVAGAKVQIGNSPFYIDFMVRPKFLLFSSKQKNVDNLVIPGYGKDKGSANISLFWGISYKLF